MPKKLIYLISFILVLGFVLPSIANAAELNLVGWWKFDGDYLDWSGYNNHGSPYGSGISTVSDPERGQVAAFNGTDDYVGTGQSLLSNMAKFTLAGWVSAGNAEAGRIGLFGQNDCVEFGFQGGDIHCYTSGGGQARTAWTEDAPTWHHIAVVGDGTTLTVYVDGGVAVIGGSTTNSYGSSTYRLNNIGGGGIWDATGNWFSGQIDDVRLYDYALSQDEIVSVRGLGALYVPVTSPANISDDEPATEKKVNFKDYALLTDNWLDEVLWP